MTKQPVQVELYYSGGWHAVPVYVRDPITIVRGRADEASGPTPATMTCAIANRTGDYNPRNPLSSLFGLIGRNTPIRVGMTLAEDDFARTEVAGWGTGPAGAWLWFGAGGTVAAADTTVSGGQGRHWVPVTNAYRGTWIPSVSLRDVELAVTVDTFISDVTGGAVEPAGLLLRMQSIGTYYMARLEISPAETVILALYGPSGMLAWTSLALVWTGQPLRVRASIVGQVLSAAAWDPATGTEPAGWHVQAYDSAITAPGAVGLRSGVASGNTNTKPVEFRYDDLVLTDRRYYGEVASWKPGRTVDFDPDTGRGDAWAAIEAAGILRRLGQGADPLASPLRRALTAATPSAYWPLEDLDGAQAGQSAVAGVDDMRPFGYSRFTAPGTAVPEPAAGLPKFGSGSGIPGSAPVVDLAEGGVLVGYPPAGDGTSWRIEWVMVCPRDKAAARIPIRWTTDGTWDTWDFQVESTGIFGTFGTGLTAAGSATASFGIFDGLPHHYMIEAVVIGGITSADLYIDGTPVASYGAFVPPMTGTPGSIRSVVVNPLEEVNGTDSMPIIGHIAVWNPYPTFPPDTTAAMHGHAGETTAARFTRLCAEQDVDAIVVGNPAEAPTMGAQRIATFADLLAEIERTDGGMVYEPRDWLGLVLRTGASLADQDAALTVDYAAEQVAPPLAPVLDDQNTRNDVTARSTATGGTARAVLESGRMSVLPPPAGVGRVTTQVDVNPADDTRLPDYAGWALHLGTVDEVRFASLTVDLVASPELLDAAASVDVGDRVTVTGLPVDVAPGEVELLVPGYTETIPSHGRTITVNATPYTPYEQVATADGDPRAPADGSTLAAGLTALGLSLSLASTAENGPWTTDPADFPLDVRVGGERITVSAITGAGSPQAATITARGVNGVQRAWPAGTEVDVWTPAVAAL
ncbi:hypothetical protein V6U90_08025 [Micromonospora sp. CPCC 206060]|uniref:hypothetical protein n=1 Tax=Micromonospora sp. CPCC 206060 TaxID=3122406 RepID=UPI002FF2C17E